MADNKDGLRCPGCYSAWSVVTRTIKFRNGKVRRYRKCQHCQRNFSTTEIVNGDSPGKKKRPDPFD